MRNPITLTSDIGEVYEFFPEDMLFLKREDDGMFSVTLRYNVVIRFASTQPEVWQELRKAFRMRGE